MAVLFWLSGAAVDKIQPLERQSAEEREILKLNQKTPPPSLLPPSVCSES